MERKTGLERKEEETNSKDVVGQRRNEKNE